MSRICKPALVYAALTLTLLFALFVPQSHADTYGIGTFTDYSGAGPILGIATNGQSVLFGNAPCYGLPPTATSCYSLYAVGTGDITDLSDLSGLSFTGRSLDPSGTTPLTLTDGSYETSFGGSDRLLYGGPIGNLHLIGTGVVADFIAIDSFGDIAWTNGALEENFYAYNETAHQTPEPETLMLLATGLAAFSTLYRRPTRSA